MGKLWNSTWQLDFLGEKRDSRGEEKKVVALHLLANHFFLNYFLYLFKYQIASYPTSL
jgi:hypothetical protein